MNEWQVECAGVVCSKGLGFNRYVVGTTPHRDIGKKRKNIYFRSQELNRCRMIDTNKKRQDDSRLPSLD